MNKFGMVLGVAAVMTLAGCKDPNFKHADGTPPQSQSEVKNVDTTTPAAVDAKPADATIVDVPVTTVDTAPKCTCAPGTKHTSPCQCGSPDCKCIVETKPVAISNLTAPSSEDYTIYVVQGGDYLAKISKKFNVTINSIKRLNPSIKKDMVRVGQKLKIPGKVDVGVQPESAQVKAAAKSAAPAKSAAKPAKKASATTYTGATKEYVVRNGDTLGSIAYGNGINIRQLKSLNSLTSDSLKIGQKLKIPAEKVVSAPVAKAAADAPAKTATAAAAPVDAAAEKAAPAPAENNAEPANAEKADDIVEVKPVEAAKADAAPAADVDKKTDAAAPAADAKKAAPAANTTTYVVQEGDDMTGVSIRWGVSAADIRELNNLGENDQLVPGQIIKLPADAQQ